MDDFSRSRQERDDEVQFDKQLDRELKLEQLKFFRHLDEERSRAKHEDALNEALRQKGYPALYPGTRRRRRS